MSLSKEPVFSELRNHFVCGYRDIANEKYAGNSGAHDLKGQAIETSNGAGSHNIQMFVLAADGTVLHCMPGYWNPQDLGSELRLAEQLGNVWQDAGLSLDQKKRDFARMQLDHLRRHSKELVARSQMQGFDKHHELMKGKASDALRYVPQAGEFAEGKVPEEVYKTTDEIMHERMSKRPFVAYASFDTGKYADYGTHYYDKHEDNLDEAGKSIDPDAKVVTMREVLNKQRARNTVSARSAPHVQVKTYGTLRRMN